MSKEKPTSNPSPTSDRVIAAPWFHLTAIAWPTTAVPCPGSESAFVGFEGIRATYPSRDVMGYHGYSWASMESKGKTVEIYVLFGSVLLNALRVLWL
jgi:hypothetical protein